jgi:hypothetical protein
MMKRVSENKKLCSYTALQWHIFVTKIVIVSEEVPELTCMDAHQCSGNMVLSRQNVSSCVENGIIYTT